MADIFLSYKTEDRSKADDLVKTLEAAGFSVWWDQHIGAGEIWRSEITEQLDRAKCVIVLWTPNSAGTAGRFVQEEASRAQRLGTYLPVKAEECALPLGFSEVQALSLTQWSGRVDDPLFARLVDLVRSTIAAPATLQADSSNSAVPTAVRSERRFVTLLRAEFVHPASKLEDPEYLDEFVGELGNVLEKELDHRISICQEFDATGFTCIFGVPSADEFDQVRAVEKALSLSEILSCRLEVGSRFGLASGIAVTTPRLPGKPPRVSSNLRSKAEAMLADAPGGKVLIPHDMQQSLAAYFETEPAGDGQWAVTSRTNVRDRIGAAEVTGMSKLSGRTAEVGLLEIAISSALQGAGQAVSLVGEPGLGKSRLLHEAASMAAERGFTLLQTTCTTFGRAQAFGPITDLLRQLFVVCGGEQESPPGPARIAEIFPVLAPYAPVLAQLVSASSTQAPLSLDADGASVSRACRDAFIALVTLAAEQQPLTILIDDFQLADELSQETIGSLAEAIAHSRALMLVAARPSGAPMWPPVIHCRQIVLPALDVIATGELLLSVTGAATIRAGLAKVIRGLTDGVPLFVEELARAMMEQGQLQIVEGQLASPAGADHASLPQSLEALVRARLDRLEPDLRTLLQTAAAIGRQFDWSLLQDLAETNQSPASLLGPALALGLIEQVRLLPEPVYRFPKQMIQQVAHDSILTRERRELHRRIGERIEATLSISNDDPLEELAYHFVEAGAAEKAVKYLLAAAQKSLGWGSARIAADLAARALAIIEERSADQQDYDQLLTAYVVLGNALTLSRGYFDSELATVVEKARAIGPSVGSDRVRLATTWWLWRHYYNCLKLEEAAECVERLRDLAASTKSVGLRLATLGADGIVTYFRGEVAAASLLLGEAASLWDPEALSAEDGGIGLVGSAMAHVFLGFTLVFQCRVSEGWAAFDTGEAIARDARQPDLELFALSYRQMALYLLNRFEEAAELNARALALAATHDRHSWEAVNRILLGRLLLQRGDLEGTAAILRELETSVAIGGGTLGIYLVLRLNLAMVRGDAATIADTAEKLAKGMELTGVRLFAVEVALARVALTWAADSRRAYAEARAVMDRVAFVGSRVGYLRMARDIAQLLIADGDADEAAKLLETALIPLDPVELSGSPIFDQTTDMLRQLRPAISNPIAVQGAA